MILVRVKIINQPFLGVSILTLCIWGCLLVSTPLRADSESTNIDASRDMERATQLIRLGKESEALVSLTDFLRRYPKHKLTAQAQFLLGEVEYRRRNFEDAIRELKKTLKYKGIDDSTVADAFFMIGLCWVHLGRNDHALIEWQALIRKYPATPAAGKAESKLVELLEGKSFEN